MIAQKKTGQNYCKDPMQYTRLILFTPAANKPAELHRINILVIEIGPCLPNHNFRVIKWQRLFLKRIEKAISKLPQI